MKATLKVSNLLQQANKNVITQIVPAKTVLAVAHVPARTASN